MTHKPPHAAARLHRGVPVASAWATPLADRAKSAAPSKWYAASNGSGPRHWYVVRDGGRDVALDGRGNYRQFSSQAAADQAAAALNREPRTNVPPIDATRIRRIFGQPDLNEVASAYRPSLFSLARSTAMRFRLIRALIALGSDGGLVSRGGLAGRSSARGAREESWSHGCSRKPAPLVPYRPPFGERLVAFARRQQFRFAVASLILATLLGCYMAWEFAR